VSAAGIRRGHRVEYVGQTNPDPLVFDELAASLLNLRRHGESRPDLWHTVIRERETTSAWIDEALRTLRF